MLDDCTSDNGPLLVVPGTHRGPDPRPPHRRSPDGRVLLRADRSRRDPRRDRARGAAHRARRLHELPPRAARARLGPERLEPAAHALALRIRRRRRVAAHGRARASPTSTPASSPASPSLEPRLVPAPVRMPLPPALHQGSIYENQSDAARRYFPVTERGGRSAPDVRPAVRAPPDRVARRGDAEEALHRHDGEEELDAQPGAEGRVASCRPARRAPPRRCRAGGSAGTAAGGSRDRRSPPRSGGSSDSAAAPPARSPRSAARRDRPRAGPRRSPPPPRARPACASSTPVEKIGSRNAAASPTATHRSPAMRAPGRSSRRRSARARHARRIAQQGGRGRRLAQVVLEALVHGGPALAPVERLRHHDADAGHPIRDRDQPHPAHVGAGEHADVARRPALGPRDALVLRVHRDVLQHRVDLVAADAASQQAGAARGVDHRLHPRGALARPAGPRTAA